MDTLYFFHPNDRHHFAFTISVIRQVQPARIQQSSQSALKLNNRPNITQYEDVSNEREDESMGDEEDDSNMVTSDHESETRRSQTGEDAEEIDNGSSLLTSAK